MVNKIKYYIAARYPLKEQMLSFSKEINKRLNWEMVSSWVENSEGGKLRKDIAEYDLADVDESDVLIIFSYPRGTKTPGGGRWVEFGFALAMGKTCVVIGSYENVFCHHPLVKVYPSLEDFILEMEIR